MKVGKGFMKFAYLDGGMVEKDRALLAATEPCVLIGHGLFETMLCVNGCVFALQEHLDRLKKSCPVVGIKAPSKSLLVDAVVRVVKKNKLSDAALRLNLCVGKERTHIFIFARPLELIRDEKYKKGFSAILYKDERIGISKLNSVKSLNHYFYFSLHSAIFLLKLHRVKHLLF